MLSYHLGDIRTHRGQLGGLREFLDGDERMGVTVQRLTEELDAGEIAALERFDIGHANTYRDVRETAYAVSETMLVPAVRTLTTPAETVSEPETVGTLYSIPNGWGVVRYAGKNAWGWARENVEKVEPDGTVRRVSPTTLLLGTGLLLATLPALVTDRSIDDLSPKQLLGLGLITAGLWRLRPTGSDGTHKTTGGRESQ